MRSLISLVLFIVLSGCSAISPNSGSDLNFLLVLNSIETSRAALAYSKMNAIREGDSNKCLATSVSSDVLAAASHAIRNDLKEIPPLKVDVSGCLALPDAGGINSDERDAALIILVDSSTKSALDTAQYYFEKSSKNTEDPEVCKNSARALAVIKYLRPLPVVILNDLQNTDGKLEIPGQPISKASC
jgi:hypothetical protein